MPRMLEAQPSAPLEGEELSQSERTALHSFFQSALWTYMIDPDSPEPLDGYDPRISPWIASYAKRFKKEVVTDEEFISLYRLGDKGHAEALERAKEILERPPSDEESDDDMGS